MKKWIDPMPAGVKITGADGLVYYCGTCRIHEVVGRAPYPEGVKFLDLYESLGRRSWDHNIKVHIEPAAAKSRRKHAAVMKPLFAAWKPPIPAGASQLSAFDLLGI